MHDYVPLSCFFDSNCCSAKSYLDLHHFLQPILECERIILALSPDEVRIKWQDESMSEVFVMNHHQFSFILKLELVTIANISHWDSL